MILDNRTISNSKNSLVNEQTTNLTKHAIVCLPNLSDIASALADFEAEGFPLYKISVIGIDVYQQIERFAGIAVSDRLNATAISVPQDKAEFYQNCIEQRQYLIVISASDRDMNKALSILEKSGIRHWRVYDQTQLVRY
jgi:hypothetical protein